MPVNTKNPSTGAYNTLSELNTPNTGFSFTYSKIDPICTNQDKILTPKKSNLDSIPKQERKNVSKVPQQWRWCWMRSSKRRREPPRPMSSLSGFLLGPTVEALPNRAGPTEELKGLPHCHRLSLLRRPSLESQPSNSVSLDRRKLVTSIAAELLISGDKKRLMRRPCRNFNNTGELSDISTCGCVKLPMDKLWYSDINSKLFSI